MNIYIRIFLIIVSVFLCLFAIKMKVYHHKRHLNKSRKDWSKYSNYNFIIFMFIGITIFTISILNIGVYLLPWITCILVARPSFINFKFGKKDKDCI